MAVQRIPTLSSYLNSLDNAPNSFNGSSNGAIISMLSGNCLPSGMHINAANGLITSESVSTAPIQLLNYVAMTKSAQAQWPGLESSSAIETADDVTNNPTPTPSTPTSPSLDCKVGTILGFIPNPLDFLFCGFVEGLQQLVDGIDDQINSLLSIGTLSTTVSGVSVTTDDPNGIFSDPNGYCSKNYIDPSGSVKPVCGAYYTAWLSFRNIALGLLVIVCLGIVIAQALGMEILDAYTIRKMLPRILIAAIAITLSWQLMRFMVTMSNDLGYGVRNLIGAPFSKIGITIQPDFGASLVGLLVGSATLAVLGLFGIMTFLGTAAIAVIVTFLVLILRQMAIILMVIIAPIALIAYVFPNTQRAYKFWWESFSKMLLMFPMIVAFITLGHIFAAISSSQGTGFIDQVIAVIAYFGPYFLVPKTFQFSGTMMGAVGNAVNSRGEGARGALRNMRAERAKKNMADLKTGERFKGKIPYTGNAADKLNRFTRRAGVGVGGQFGFGKKGKDAVAMVEAEAAANLARDPKLQAIRGKNDVNRAMVAGSASEAMKELVDHHMSGGDDGKTKLTRAQAEERAKRAIGTVKAAGGWSHGRAIAGYYNMVRDGTAIRDTKDLGRLAAMVGQGNDINTLTFAAEGASMSKAANRHDLAASTETITDVAFMESDKQFNGGVARLYNPAAEGKPVKTETQIITASKLSANGNSQDYEWLTQAKGRALRNSSDFMAEVVANKEGKYSPEEVQQAATQMTSRLSAIKSGLGADNKRIDAYQHLAAAVDPEDAAAGITGIKRYEEYMKEQTGETRPDEQLVRTLQVERSAEGENAGQVVALREELQPKVGEKAETNKDRIADVGGVDRQQGLSDAQRAEFQNRGGGPQEPEEQ